MRLLQSLTAQPNPDRAAVEAALVEVEKSRVIYDQCRDALAEHLLSSSNHRAEAAIPRARDDYREHVKDIAELLWETAGRPEGTAEADWRKAEEIVKRARAAA